jgi:hypothetical protein
VVHVALFPWTGWQISVEYAEVEEQEVPFRITYGDSKDRGC